MKIKKMDLRDYIDFSETGKIMSVTDERLLIFDAVALGLLRKELIEMFGVFGTRNVLTRFGYAHGYRTAEMLKAKNPEALTRFYSGAAHHLMYGITYTAEMNRVELENGRFLMNCYLSNSYEAEQHLQYFGLVDEPVCWTITGFASGYETSKNNSEFYFMEYDCVGKGDKQCMMQGRYKEDWDESALKELLPFYGMASANAMLKELSERLHKTQVSLSNCKVKLNVKHSDDSCGIVMRSKQMQNVLNLSRRSAIVDSSVMVMGESGVGKEVISRFIHDNSKRADKPFIAVNCGAFSDTLLESELFGHVKGSFTGAGKDHRGLFEEADGGTLFLDEIGETSPQMQVKLLRVLQEKEIRRVGESRSRKVDVRIITATNRNLLEEVNSGNFRKDLYYRLRVIEVVIPPLRERTEDILPLAHLFIKMASKRMNKEVTGISSDAARNILGYGWPGNVRELQNAIERAVALAYTNLIQLDDLPYELQSAMPAPVYGDDVRTLADVEKNYIISTLEACGGDKQKAADKLDIGLSTLYKRLKEYNG